MSKQTKDCPYCGEEILAVAIKCKFCRSMLANAPTEDMDSETYIRNALASRFEVVEELGSGGMSVVYKAIQKNLNRPVALKVLHQKTTHDKEFVESFHEEARTAAQLSHRNIVTIYDEGLESGVHFIVMEYVDGQDLHEIIADTGPMSVEQMKEMLLPIIEGLGHAHELGLVHRDIKSGNILNDNKNRPVLIDFGIAQSPQSKKTTGTQVILGTPEYMSPEQTNAKTTDVRSDIYSIGIVMYECLTGQLPFRSENINETLEKINNVPPTPPRGIKTDIPEKIEKVILTCLAKDPDERYASCTELIEAITTDDSTVKKKTISKPKPGKLETSRTQTVAMPWWWKSAIATVLLVLALISVLIIKKMNEPPKQPPPPPPNEHLQTGKLLIKTEPWSTVFLDGKEIGFTPLEKLVTAGKHKLTFEFSQQGYTKQSKKITVAGNDTIKINEDFTK